MNDGPGLSAWDLANARTAPLDRIANERLARELARERDPEFRVMVEGDYPTRRAVYDDPSGPHWPAWAKHPAHCPRGRCAACHGPLNASGRGPRNLSGICGTCGRRAHRYFPRMTLALRQFRAGEWKP